LRPKYWLKFWSAVAVTRIIGLSPLETFVHAEIVDFDWVQDSLESVVSVIDLIVHLMHHYLRLLLLRYLGHAEKSPEQKQQFHDLVRRSLEVAKEEQQKRFSSTVTQTTPTLLNRNAFSMYSKSSFHYKSSNFDYSESSDEDLDSP